MPCNPLQDSDFNVGPPSPFPGAGGFAPQLPPLNIPFPDIPLEDLKELFDLLEMILPPGSLKPSFEPDFLNDIYGGIYSILEKFLPFLMLYKFILPILNLILCIIEILCALTNPIKLIRALRRLFRVCIPDFLALFPFFALILMIISLILLIIALIEYIINRIIRLIEIILANIIILSKAASRSDNDGIIAIVKKIGDLLCLLQNLFIIFAVIALIIQIIKDMLSLLFKIPPCDSSDGSSDGCCTPDVCPEFIKNNPTITSSTGNFLYFNQVGTDSGLILPLGFPPLISQIRAESWQFYDPSLTINQEFYNITHAFDLPPFFDKVFFPSGTSYNEKTSPSSTPYNISFRLFYDPTVFGRTDPLGARYIKIVNAIVQSPPTDGVLSYDGTTFIAPFNGTLNLIGGVMEEDDGTPILDPTNNPYSINAFFHLPTNDTGPVPSPTDGILFSDLTYTFTINYEVLVGASLITVGCVPDVAADRDFINNTIGAQFNLNGDKLASIVPLLPDMDAAQQCVVNAITTYRQSISTQSTNQFQTSIMNCLNDLRASSANAITATITAGFDQYNSTFSIDPSIQFTGLPIAVSVSLNESSSTLMTNKLPADIAATVASQLKGQITFGKISDFTYDGSQLFVANITSDKAGNGEVSVLFNNNFISVLNNPPNIDQSPSVSIKSLPYTFVQSPLFGIPGDGQPRRDEGDVASDVDPGVSR